MGVQMKKKIIGFILAVWMVFTATGCGMEGISQDTYDRLQQSYEAL